MSNYNLSKNPKRASLAKSIADKLRQEKESLFQQYAQTKEKIGFLVLDDVLPEKITQEINSHFPTKKEMKLKKNLRENKYIGAQMDHYHPLIEEVTYAFQDPLVVNLIKDICEIEQLEPDEHLYAAGISTMGNGQFLNPHLDNSHDKDRARWRVLNLLFYVTPSWEESYGGHLEIWPDGTEKESIKIHSKFNRLIVMATHQSSWHSVSPILTDSSRNCVSNYYFSAQPLLPSDKFHVTTFRGRPEQKIRSKLLKIDSFIRMGIRKIFKKGIRKNPHVYKK